MSRIFPPTVSSKPRRVSLFALVGVAFLAHWIIADPGYEASASQTEWPYVLGFSAALISLGFALPIFGQMIGGKHIVRWSMIAGAGAAVSSLANVVEDGMGVDWAFFVFVLGAAIIDMGLLVLAGVLAIGGRGKARLLALIPAGTLLAVLAYVAAGGVVMLVTWLAAAAVAALIPAPPTFAAGPERNSSSSS